MTSPPAAADVFAEADEALGEPITPLCYDGPEEDLDLTVNAQPAHPGGVDRLPAALEERAGAVIPAFYAGHSMGQYSAMVAAGVISLADGLRLVRERGRQMQASAEDGAMAAIIGLDDDAVPELEAAGAAVGVVHDRQPQLARPDRRQRRARGRRGRRGGGQGARRQARDRAAGQRRRPLAADGARRRGDARASSPTSSSATRARRCWPTPTRGR